MSVSVNLRMSKTLFTPNKNSPASGACADASVRMYLHTSN